MKNVRVIIAILCSIAIPLVRAAAGPGEDSVTLYVATNGDDGWSGRLAAPNEGRTDGPLASLAGARDAVRDLRKDDLQGITVVVRGGVYYLEGPVALTREDSGTEACPITYRAEPGQKVVLSGGRIVRGWAAHRDGVYRADLKAQGLEGVRFHQLFYRGTRQVLARHPNFDPKHPRTGGFLYTADSGYRPAEQLVYEEGTIPFDEWGEYPQAEVWSVFGRGWNFALTPILDVDTERRLITVRRVRRPFETTNRFFIQNVLGALDAPGEWFLDRQASVLYFYPPNGRLRDGDVVVPALDNLIEVTGSIPYPHGYLNVAYRGTREDFPVEDELPAYEPVEYLRFEGFRLECARQNAVRLVGARRCAVIGNVVTNVGNVGINLGGVASAHEEVGNPRIVPAEGYSGGVGGGGQNLLYNDPCQECRVDGNDVFSVGSDGIFLYGTGNVAENNHVYDTGLFDKDCAGINLWGERNVARRNDLHDVPRNAVFLKGVENVVELNEIHRTMLETCDGGAIRMCQRNLYLRGNVIRHNRILDTVGYGYPMGSGVFQAPYYSWGVYLDDFTCGTTVYGNIIARTGRAGVHVHGGSDNIVENNVVVGGAQYQFENNPIRENPVSGNRVRRNVFVYDGDGALLYRCGKWLDGSVAWERNLVWSGDGPVNVELGLRNLIEGWDAWEKMGLDKGSEVGRPMFRDEENDDYRLLPASPAWKLGFAEIPVEQIGCYESAERASWPLQVRESLVREEPVLYVAPTRPVREDFELEMAGRPPRHGDVSAPGKASLIVTDETAAGGKHSLKIVDAPGLPNRWQPRIYYPLKLTEGAARFACDFRLDGQQPPELVVDLRQYSDTGGREYFSGPIFAIDPPGRLRVGETVLATVPFDEWFRIEILMRLGEDAPREWKMTLSVPGREPQTFELPHRNPEFQRLERLVIMSNSQTETAFYIDNVECVG
ncbi:MAG: right-handed parallel beta-helix repeat-containing protein, partial [Armatimonadota bacterium]